MRLLWLESLCTRRSSMDVDRAESRAGCRAARTRQSRTPVLQVSTKYTIDWTTPSFELLKAEKVEDVSNYSSRIVFSYIRVPIECGHTGNSVIQTADPQNPTVEPNMKWIGRPLAEIWPFEFFLQNVRSSVAGRRSVGRQYNFFLHWSQNSVRYVRNVARED